MKQTVPHGMRRLHGSLKAKTEQKADSPLSKREFLLSYN